MDDSVPDPAFWFVGTGEVDPEGFKSVLAAAGLKVSDDVSETRALGTLIQGKCCLVETTNQSNFTRGNPNRTKVLSFRLSEPTPSLHIFAQPSPRQ